MTVDMINHPPHYNSHPSGIEVIRITEQMHCPNLGNAFKYLARHPYKGLPEEDLGKAQWYINRELRRRQEFYPKYINTGAYAQVCWRPEFEPFYLYIAGDPSPSLRNLLITLWNVDKIDDLEVYPGVLRHLEETVGEMIEELLSTTVEPAAPPTVATFVPPEHPVPAPPPVTPVLELPDHDAEDGAVVYDTGDVDDEDTSGQDERTITARGLAHSAQMHHGDEILIDGAWYPIVGIRRTRGGIVWVDTDDGDETRYTPQARVTIRKVRDA